MFILNISLYAHEMHEQPVANSQQEWKTKLKVNESGIHENKRNSTGNFQMKWIMKTKEHLKFM